MTQPLAATTTLTARSVVISALLGYHPPELPVSALVRIGGLFGIADGTVRVAVGRMVTDGDLVFTDGVYRLTERLIARQGAQDESCSPRTKFWRGSWELAVVTAPTRPRAERDALRRIMTQLRMAELREGVWTRPANLVATRPQEVLAQCTFFSGRPEEDPRELAASLWDLETWAGTARGLHVELATCTGLVEGFLLTAEILHLLRADPVLPPELLPADWPGPELRADYAEFSVAYAELLRDYSLGGTAAKSTTDPPGRR